MISSPNSVILSHALTAIDGIKSSNFELKCKTLLFDTDVTGLEKFPSEFLSKLVPFGLNYKSNFTVVDQKIPALKSLSYITNKIHLTLANAHEMYEFTLKEKETGAKVKITAGSIEFRGSYGFPR